MTRHPPRSEFVWPSQVRPLASCSAMMGILAVVAHTFVMRIARACVENDRPPGGLVDGNVPVPQIPVDKNRLQRSPLRFQWSEKPGDDLVEPLLSKLPHFFIRAVGALFHVECVGKASGEGLLQAVAVRQDQWVLPAIHVIR